MLSNLLMVETDSGRMGFDYLRTAKMHAYQPSWNSWVPFQKGEKSFLWSRAPLATYLSESTLDTVI